MATEGHRFTFGAPAGGGWPTFGPDGKIVRPHPAPERAAAEAELEELSAPESRS